MNKKHKRGLLWFDRALSRSLWSQFSILGLTFIFALGLSYLMLSLSGAEWKEFCDSKDLKQWLLPMYLLIDSNALNNLYIGCEEADSAVHGWMLIASSISFVIGAFVFNGMIIGFITNSIGQRVADHREGHIHYLKSGHYIIMGYDDMVPSIIAHIFERDKKAFILLLSAAKSENLREKLRKVFDEKQLDQVIINYGHRTSKDFYKDIHLENAERVYIVGHRQSPSHDAINVECVDSICSYLEQPGMEGHPKRITCVFEDLDTYSAFKTSDIFKRAGELGIEIVPYNFYTGWAKQMFVKQCHKDMDNPGKEIKYPAVYGEGCLEGDKRFVHLVFVGTTNFAVAFAMEAAHVLHFPNWKDAKTLITFIDKNADEEKDEFIIRNRHFFEVQPYYYSDLSKDGEYGTKESRIVKESLYFTEEKGYTENDSGFLDVEFEFIKGDVFSRKVQDVICGWAKEHGKTQYLSIFLANSVQRQNFVMSMNMPDTVYDNEVPIFIRQDRSDNFVSDLRQADEKIRTDEKRNIHFKVVDGHLESSGPKGGRYANIYPFGMNETAYCTDERSLERAKLVNYLYSTMSSGNKFQSIMALNTMSDEQLATETDGYWQKLDVAEKWSNLYNAYNMNVKLACLRSMRHLDREDDTSSDTKPLTDEEIKVMAAVEHNRWNVEKLLMGYRKPHLCEDCCNEKNGAFAPELKKNKKRFIHHDIRPFDQLDEKTQNLDREFSRYIPWIIEKTESIK